MSRVQNIIRSAIFLVMGIIYCFMSGYSRQIPNLILSPLLIFLCLIYLFGYKKLDFNKISSAFIMGCSVVFAIILFIAPLKTGSDTTNYILGARVAFIGKYNPFTTPYSQFKTDPIYRNFEDYAWSHTAYTYSPLFLYLSGFLLYLSGGNFWTNVILFKLVFLLTYISGIYLLGRINKRSDILYLYSLNPIILNELVKEAHIESLTIILLMIALYFYLKKRHFASFLIFISSAMLKIYYLQFIPFFFINLIKLHKHRIRQVILMNLCGFIIFALLYLPFWRGESTFSGIIRLVSGHSDKLISLNFLSVLIMPLTGKFIDDPYRNYTISGYILLIIGAIMIILYAIRLLYKKANFRDLPESLNIVYLIFLLFMVNWFFPHYATISIFLSVFLYSYQHKKIYLNLIFFLSLFSSIYYLIL